MAANKFATMLHRKSNKFTLVLVYAMLEWMLIFLLLLNSLFSYLIIKFADYFGLKRPCLWCSRLDHFFEPAKFQNSYRSLVCETHAMEISKLRYCSNHRKLAESKDMCEDCSSSQSHHAELSNKFAFFPWMKKLGVIQDCFGDNIKVSENCEVISKCSCCGVNLETRFCCPDDYLMKPFWGDLDNTQKGNLILETELDDKIDEKDNSDRKKSGFVCDRCGEEQRIDENRGIEDENRDDKTGEDFSCFISSFDCIEMVADEIGKVDLVMEKEQESVKKSDLNVSVDDDPSCEKVERVEADCDKNISREIQPQPQHLEFYIDQNDCHLIPIELVGSSPIKKQILDRNVKREEEICGNEDFVLEFDKHVGTQYDLVVEERSIFEEKVPLLPILESEEENMAAEFEPMEFNGNESSPEFQEDFELVKEDLGQVFIAQPTQTPTPTSNGDGVKEFSETTEEDIESDNNHGTCLI